MLLSAIRRLLGFGHSGDALRQARAEQHTVAQELDRVKRARFIDLDVEVERTRGPKVDRP